MLQSIEYNVLSFLNSFLMTFLYKFVPLDKTKLSFRLNPFISYMNIKVISVTRCFVSDVA